MYTKNTTSQHKKSVDDVSEAQSGKKRSKAVKCGEKTGRWTARKYNTPYFAVCFTAI